MAEPGEMSKADIENNLEALRKRYKLSDFEVLTQALEGTMIQDADHHAWLILLGRGDLINTRRKK